MPFNSCGVKTEDTKISRIRKLFLEDYDINNQLYDECDAQRVRESDWAVNRFLVFNKMNEELALKNLTEALQWRKSFGVNIRTDDYFPTDFYQMGAIFQYQTDKEGVPLIYLRLRCHHKVKELTKFFEEFFVHQINKIDISSGYEWAVVFDCSNGGLSNADMDFAAFIATTLWRYFPSGIKYALIYELPWILTAISKVIIAILPEEVYNRVKFVKEEEIFKFIERENVPQYIPGGKCTKSIQTIPEGVKPPELLPHHDFNEEQINRFRAIFNINVTQM